MRQFSTWLLGTACAFLASPAFAGTLTSATWVQTAKDFPLTRTASDARWSYSGTSTSTSVAVDVNYFFTSTIFGVPKTPNGVLDIAVGITQGGTQHIAAATPGPWATVGVRGEVLEVGGLPLHVGHGQNQSKFRLGASTLVQVPMSAGNSGLITNTFDVVGVNHTLTVQFYSWTVGTAMFTCLTSHPLNENPGSAKVLPNVTAAGSFNLTPNGGGMVTLVSPSKVDIDGA